MPNKIMGHFVLGYPNLKRSIEIAVEYEKNGIDVLECQFPFSDPSADGTIISNANIIASAYSNNDLLDALAEISRKTTIPIVLMSYITRVYNIGVDKFFGKCSEMGIKEFIIPDLPFDEAIRINFIEEITKYSCALIPVISANTATDRVQEMDKGTFTFYYMMSYYGTTGNEIEIDKKLKNFVERVQKISSKQIGIGFGIKNKAQIEKINSFADFSIIGSELLRHCETNSDLTKYIKEIK